MTQFQYTRGPLRDPVDPKNAHLNTLEMGSHLVVESGCGFDEFFDVIDQAAALGVKVDGPGLNLKDTHANIWARQGHTQSWPINVGLGSKSNIC